MEDDEIFVKLDSSYKADSSGSFRGELRYNREKRLENAPSNVKVLHSPDYIKKQSFFSCIVNNRGHKFIFISIVILAILNLALYFYYNSFSSGKIDGIEVELDSFHYNGELLVNLVLSEAKMKDNEVRDVKALFSAFNAKGEELEVSESGGVYIGAKLVLHFKMSEKDVKKVVATLIIGSKKIVLSKKV